MPRKLSTQGFKRLEITMRDVMDGLEDAASYINYQSTPDVIEILSIEPAGRPIASKAQVISMNLPDSDIVEYIIQRELKKSA